MLICKCNWLHSTLVMNIPANLSAQEHSTEGLGDKSSGKGGGAVEDGQTCRRKEGKL